MKRFGLMITAAVIGSAFTLGVSYLFERNPEQSLPVKQISGTPVVKATYTVNKNGEIVPLDFTDVASKVMPAVVHIKSTQLQTIQRSPREDHGDPFRDFFGNDFFKFFGPGYRDGYPGNEPRARTGSGSGVIINADGYIVTNRHVIDGAEEIDVTLEDNRVFRARVLGTDASTDLALLQIKEKNLPYVPLINSDEVEVGEWVLAVGNPFNLSSTVTAGIVSAKGRNINILHDRSAIESFIQTDAAINPGNSGGALVNLEGGLVGINTAIASPTGTYTGYGFAVPANIVAKVVKDLKTYGTVQRGYLGLMIRSLDGNLAAEKDLKLTEGVYVDSITAHSAAGDAGVEAGDVILEIDDIPVKQSSTLIEIISRHYPGDQVSLKINRKGKELLYQVTLRNLDGKEKINDRESGDILGILGIDLEEISNKTAEKLDVEGGLRITRLSNGKLKQETKIKDGFIITRVDGKRVRSIEAFVRQLENSQGGILLEGVYEDFPGTYYYAFGL
jgi:serine protease Do